MKFCIVCGAKHPLEMIHRSYCSDACRATGRKKLEVEKWNGMFPPVEDVKVEGFDLTEMKSERPYKVNKLNALLPVAKDVLKDLKKQRRHDTPMYQAIKALVAYSETPTKTIPSGLYNNLKVYNHSFLDI